MPRDFDLYERTLWNSEHLDVKGTHPETDYKDDNRRPAQGWDDANLVFSGRPDGLHAPAIDLDIAAFMVPSSTLGHSHLYINNPVSWWRYRRLLRELFMCGIINEGFYKASIERKGTFLRRPGYLKPN